MKGDDITRKLLTAGIALLYPIVVYLAIRTVLPGEGYDNQYADFWDGFSSDPDNLTSINRSIVGLLVGAATMAIAVLSLRQQRELFRGLLVGSFITTFVASLVLFTAQLDQTQAGAPLSGAILLLSFMLHVALLYLAEREFPHKLVKRSAPKS